MINDNFLLTNDISRELYHSYAKELPIIDYHNHLSAKEIYEDRMYENLTELWLADDHYKWRAMRANGISEYLITGDASDKDKFDAWADTVPNLIGNPLYHWTHLELTRFFNLDSLLGRQTKAYIWEKTTEMLKTNELSARNILTKQKVEFVGTTDDPTDNLTYHKKLKEEGFPVVVSPSFRPDKGLMIEGDHFIDWVIALSEVAEYDISDYEEFLFALEKRAEYFDLSGCRSADHGLNELKYQHASLEYVSTVFRKRMKDERLSTDEITAFKSYTLTSLGRIYNKKGWAMQLHIGPIRNTNTKKYRELGPDTGFDSIGDSLAAQPLSRLLDSLEVTGELPKTILYTNNAKHNDVFASMAGNYQGDSMPGKVQFGTAWWHNDNYEGMIDQMTTLGNMGVLKHFIGMLTDSRSMLSFVRHEYFRRILCQMLGEWVTSGKAPHDIELLGNYVKDISYGNAKRYFRL
ncbi:glucuronate isomerase [Bacillus sp. H-16]|uniref:glucuronate isomerase n=1 Tax=Alteribacter salitolerans TaxID=2912333 RepID=UPI0019627D65|nr:glucuronate isomerase [Alteribacter salitolerans]MBM7097771.1 glucuronate isomerase [Alteribacter salitolerans]